MPSKAPHSAARTEKTLRALGQQLRAERKRQKISAEATAEAAALSRVTLYRIEKGEPSVTVGAYVNVILALGLNLEVKSLLETKQNRRSEVRKLPSKIRLDDYKQLKQLAWQLKGTQELSPQQALELYERNWRHVDFEKMETHEREFLQNLLEAFGRERLLV